MKLEVGKFYKTRDGRKVGPILLSGGVYYPFYCDSCTYSEDGRFLSGRMLDADLIAEWQDEPPESTTTRAHILDTAKQYVTQDRQNTHGKPEDTFGLIAQLWGAYLGRAISPVEVCAMMALLKIARIKMNPKHIDSYVDLCGYGACAGELASKDDG